MKTETLYIQTITRDGQTSSFPNLTQPAKLSQYTYTAQRMDGVPQISATVNYQSPLKESWTGKEFVVFNGAKFYLQYIPSSKKTNDNLAYTHDVIFVSERIKLEREFFYDVVTANTETQYKDRYRSNLSDFSFMGTIEEFVARLNDALVYTELHKSVTPGLFDVVIDSDVPVDDIVELSFESTTLSEAIKKINTEFGLPFYWVGNTCHVGFTDNTISHTFEYGSNGGALSVSNTNKGEDRITRITGTGSSDNIPFYYPNDNEYGSAIFSTENFNQDDVESINLEQLQKYVKNPFLCTLTLQKNDHENVGNKLNLHEAIIYGKDYVDEIKLFRRVDQNGNTSTRYYLSANIQYAVYADLMSTIDFSDYKFHILEFVNIDSFTTSGITINVAKADAPNDRNAVVAPTNSGSSAGGRRAPATRASGGSTGAGNGNSTREAGGSKYPYNLSADNTYTFVEQGWYIITVQQMWNLTFKDKDSAKFSVSSNFFNVKFTPYGSNILKDGFFFVSENGDFIPVDKGVIDVRDINALPYTNSVLVWNKNQWATQSSRVNGNAAIIKITGRNFIYPSSKLMPSIYRESGGAQRYYNAENSKYPKTDGGYFVYKNLYDANNPFSAVQEFENIKPTITDIKNTEGQFFGEIADIAFDDNDNDALNSNNEYIHSYFYIKLHIFNGDYGFNLFEQALESDTAKISMTTGNCAACEFEIGVIKQNDPDRLKYIFKNPVQVDENTGYIKSGNYTFGDIKDGLEVQGTKINTSNYQPIQQDTTQNEVWIAVKKENSTFGVVMPNASRGYKPQVGDKFVILGIKMPKVYVLAAEKRLDTALVKYMYENNEEKFDFSIVFSRVWLQYNKAIGKLINESAKVKVLYCGKKRELYVRSCSIKADGNILNEISVELTDDIGIAQSVIDKKLSAERKKVVSITRSVEEKVISIQQSYSKRNTTFFENIDTQITRVEENVTDRSSQSPVYLIKNNDSTAPSEGNAYSASRTRREFMRKTADEETPYGITAKTLKAIEAVIADRITSSSFISGLTGFGFGITKDNDGNFTITTDNLTVRQSMNVMELLINKVRSTGGQIVVSSANGKVATVSNTATNEVVLTFEGNDPTGGFRAGDLMRCATIQNNVPYGYWVEVKKVENGSVYILRSEFGDVMPMVGDECVLMGSATDTHRQNLILISANEDGQPRVDVMNGVKEKNYNNALRVRLGNLDGIRDVAFPDDLQPKGDGLYADNVFLKGQFVLVNADGSETDISQSLKIVNGISATVENIQRGGNNLLVDTAFERSLDLSIDGKSRRGMNGAKYALDGNVRGYSAVKVSESGRTANGYKGTFYYRIAVKPNTKYTYSCWYKLEASASDSDIPTFRTEFLSASDGKRIKFFDSESKPGATADWVYYTRTFTTPTDTTEMELTSFVLKNGTLWLAGQILNEGDTALPWGRSVEDEELRSKDIASLNITQNEISSEVKKIADNQEALSSEISQTANNISLYVNDATSKAGMTIDADGVIFTADKFAIRSKKVFNEDGSGKKMLDVYEDELGYVHLRLSGPNDQNTLDLSWLGITQVLADAIQATMEKLGKGLVATGSITLTASKFATDETDTKPYFTYIGSAYLFTAMRTKNEVGNYIVPGYGQNYDGKFFKVNTIDTTRNQPTDTTLATNGLYYTGASAWIGDKPKPSGLGFGLNEYKQSRTLNFAVVKDGVVKETIYVTLQRWVIDDIANSPFFEGGGSTLTLNYNNYI